MKPNPFSEGDHAVHEAIARANLKRLGQMFPKMKVETKGAMMNGASGMLTVTYAFGRPSLSMTITGMSIDEIEKVIQDFEPYINSAKTSDK